MEEKDFNQFFYSICDMKENVVKLSLEKKKEFKKKFYNSNFSEWRLNLIWEYFHGDKPYEEIYNIFFKKKMIKSR